MDFKFKANSTQPVHLQLEQYFRDIILRGVLKEGERLPPLAGLAEELGVSFRTAQKVFCHLKASGFIHSSPRLGTFVGDKADKAFIVILFDSSLADESSPYLRGLLRAFQSELELMRDCQWRCQVYDGLEAWKDDPLSRDALACRRLLSDLRSESLQGVIMLGGMAKECLTEVRWDEIPCVCMGRLPSETDVLMDVRQFGLSVGALMADRGLSKIAYLRSINSPRHGAVDLDGLDEAIRRWGLSPVQVNDLSAELDSLNGAQREEFAEKETLRMVEGWERSGVWPDVLMLTDDTLMRGAALALIKKGVDVPGRLLVIGGANEGIDHHYGIPVIRYRFPVRGMACAALDILKARVRGIKSIKLPVEVVGQGFGNGVAPEANIPPSRRSMWK